MKNILLIGVGGTGSRAVDIFFKKFQELGKHNDNHISALVFDTDAGDIKSISAALPVVMTDTASVGTICDRLGKEHLREWFPCDEPAIRSQEMLRGASQWRKKSYLAFMNLMNKPLGRANFIKALENMVANPGGGCEIYVISSVAGGTGSGSFIPISLFAKRYLRQKLGKDPIVNAMIALPEIYADSQTPENRVKIYANAYAILRELNAINLVARNYNEGRSAQKKAPIKFRIGHPDEPNMGVLFDASDKRFWTPEAAPFSQVFLLDRIPGLNSIMAHDMVLANSLYAILCTDIGSEFDSEFSNHELLRSQNNGSNAVYAGISTSQLRFPKESVLNYLAHKKTLDACDSEWLLLHKKVENIIKEKEQQAKEVRTRFVLGDGEYAQLVLEALDQLEENGGNETIIDLVDRGTAIMDDEGKKTTDTSASLFFERLLNSLQEKVPEAELCKKELDACLSVPAKVKITKDDIHRKAGAAYDKLLAYFEECVDTIKRVTTSTSDAVVTLDSKKLDYADSDWSINKNILCNNGAYIHPVAALVQLCRFRKLITEKLREDGILKAADAGNVEWDVFRQRTVDDIPSELMSLKSAKFNTAKGETKVNTEKSGYFRTFKPEDRFIQIKSKSGRERYNNVRTDVREDHKILKSDANSILMNLSYGAQTQLRVKVLLLIAKNVDILINKYRAFFNRFEKEKEDLVEAAKTAERLDAGTVDSAINVYSSVENKKEILKAITEEGGPATDAEIREVDNVVGQGVYDTVYKSAVAATSKDADWNDKDSSAYRSLFTNMIASYKTFIGESEAFQNIASYNVVEAMLAACGRKATKKDIELKLHEDFAVAQEFAKPSLRVNETGDFHDLVRPSTITVFMMSLNTARYIKRHAEEFDLHLPADQTNEKDVVKSCAEEFIRSYSGNSAARVAIVSTIPDQILYCTGEIMDITPLRIAKFDEMGNDNTYYRYYREALANSKKYNTEMWNPHLGNNLQKRGYLPYMNEEKEKECDALVVKALLYAFSAQPKQIQYTGLVGNKNNRFFVRNGKAIKDSDGNQINVKNISRLLDWLRNEDDLVEEWSQLFDESIKAQKLTLPAIASATPAEISALERALTESPFMSLLTSKLYDDDSEIDKVSCKKVCFENGKMVSKPHDGPTLFEFAYMVKNSEEIGRDCDDAERILQVAYAVFKELCEYRTNPESSPELFIQVYKQQLCNVYEAIAGSKFVSCCGTGAAVQFNQMADWMHNSGVFNDISRDVPTDDKGNLCIIHSFNYKEKDNVEVARILKFIECGCKNKKGDATDATEEIVDEE